MSEYVCIPAEDVQAHVEAALREVTRTIASKVRDHLEAAHDDEAIDPSRERVAELISDNGWDVDDLDMELSLDDVTQAIDKNGWGFDELDIKPDLDTVRDIVQEQDWSASELGIASTDIDDCVAEHGTHDTLQAILARDENGAVTVAHTLWGLMRESDREAFLASAQKTLRNPPPPVDLDKLREEIRAEMRAEMLGKLATLLG
jgi:hypothetical protein